ncbi:alpha/beta hydrolase-fold protein [Pleionea sp. CnH1-48]|uniref:alpha/beta hydrolase-fold protein n=1 Tax=Pleionea sp. CnH1-48 TaxID=2954494 RepID=UPI002096CEC4|nr:alpha/beta hydrolase-fold protein [Pleionea sp. CnH1-48]MCO7225131.1 alpha/beta hydrolase-fold protein [Pleionea sp. CnH1-48]
MHRLLILSIKILFIITLSAIPIKRSLAKDFSIAKRVTINSKILDEKRSIIISLPEEYGNSDVDYPVLYLLDGGANLKHVVGSAELLTNTGSIPPMIIVGVESANRTKDMTISRDETQSPESGEAKSFMKFIEEELFPYIDNKYRTHSYRVLEGHSFGGLFSAYAMIKKPSLFNAYIIISPALWWNQREIFSHVQSYARSSSSLEHNLYFAIGEQDGMGMRKELESFVKLLQESNLANNRLKYEEFKGEGHMSATLLSNYYGLKFIFSDIQYPRSKWDNFSSDEFRKHELDIKNKYGKVVKQSGETYADLGFHLLENKNYDGATTVFQSYVKHYSEHAQGFSWLANALEMSGKTREAIEAYKKAYDIAHKSKVGDGNAQDYLKKISLLENPIVVDDSQLQSYVGIYKSPQFSFQIIKEESRLKGKMDGRPDFYLYPESSSLFYLKVAEAKFEFVTNSEGKTEAINFYANGKVFEVNKVD